VDRLTRMMVRPPDLIAEFEPRAIELLKRHLATAREWFLTRSSRGAGDVDFGAGGPGFKDAGDGVASPFLAVQWRSQVPPMAKAASMRARRRAGAAGTPDRATAMSSHCRLRWSAKCPRESAKQGVPARTTAQWFRRSERIWAGRPSVSTESGVQAGSPLLPL